jgi:taurine dioxygenase
MIEVSLPSPHMGAIITGVDVTAMSEAEFRVIYGAWLDRNMICVRGQTLTKDQYLDFGRRFGRLKPHRVKQTRDPAHPEITLMGVNKTRPDGTLNPLIVRRGASWHTDSPWDQDICKGTMLYALAIPSRGGDTLFTNMYRAYDALPDRLKARIQGLEAEFVYGGLKRQGVNLLDPEDRDLPPAVHPIARVHEETGRTSLYINPTHLTRLRGTGEDESKALLDELFPYMLQPGADYRHKWQVGDIVLWDNRCSLHAATGDHPPEEDRIHWRVTVMASDSNKALAAAE